MVYKQSLRFLDIRYQIIFYSQHILLTSLIKTLWKKFMPHGHGGERPLLEVLSLFKERAAILSFIVLFAKRRCAAG